MNSTIDLADQILEALTEAGFSSTGDLDYFHADGVLTVRERKVLGYYDDRGWLGWRVEAGAHAGDAAGWTLARWTDAGIELVRIDVNGVIDTEARFSYSERGVAWMSAALVD